MKITEKELKNLIAEAMKSALDELGPHLEGDPRAPNLSLGDLSAGDPEDVTSEDPQFGLDSDEFGVEGGLTGPPAPGLRDSDAGMSILGQDETTAGDRFKTAYADNANRFSGEAGDPYEYVDMGHGRYAFRKEGDQEFQLATGDAVGAIHKLRQTGKSGWTPRSAAAPTGEPDAGETPAPPVRGTAIDDEGQITTTDDFAASQAADMQAARDAGERTGIFSKARADNRKARRATAAMMRRSDYAGEATPRDARRATRAARGNWLTGNVREGTENEGEVLQEQKELNRWKKIAGLNENKK